MQVKANKALLSDKFSAVGGVICTEELRMPNDPMPWKLLRVVSANMPCFIEHKV
ncbi:hypothetical protein EDC56_3667 [Sinobacterium caligoides]|uniref:Uncharacterized protein n=1 Tax=Sinobacterium caligoides TaxID=933926 RepID=A0A3N2DEB3_9GAMM|nr:hypothetical protein EDC56_3667 [Sinobacterium caligoides]